jgi:hypothetical protein
MSSERKQQLMELDIHRRKLVTLLGELLKKADELDQTTTQFQSQSQPRLPSATPMNEEWHQLLASTCRELAALSETASNIEPLIKAGKVDAAQSALLRGTKVAQHLSQRLNELKRQAHQ